MIEQTDPVLLSCDGAIATITFNRPAALNALNGEMASQFLAACRTLKDDSGISVILLKGAGRVFMAGGDIQMLKEQPERVASELIAPMQEGLLLLRDLDVPVVAVVQGAVAGGGLSLILHADFILAAQGTVFNTAYINLGASGDLGITWTLPRLVGQRKAMELLYFASPISAEEAQTLGLINYIVPADKLAEQAAAFADKLASGPIHAYGNLKRLLRRSGERDLLQQMDDEGRHFSQCLETEYTQKALQAFLKR